MREKIVNCLLVIAGGVLLVSGREMVKMEQDIHQTAVALQQLTAEANLTVRAARVAITDKQNGLLAIEKETHLAIRQGRKVEDVILQTSLAERGTFQKSSDETAALLGNASHLVANLDSRTANISDTLNHTLSQSQETLASTSKAMDAAAGILADPKIHETLANLASTSSNAALMSSDAQTKFHLILFPPTQPWYMRTVHFAETVGQLTFDALTLK